LTFSSVALPVPAKRLMRLWMPFDRDSSMDGRRSPEDRKPRRGLDGRHDRPRGGGQPNQRRGLGQRSTPSKRPRPALPSLGDDM
jgi:hypothetical protein